MKPTIPYVHLDIAGVMKTVVDDAGMRRGMSGELIWLWMLLLLLHKGKRSAHSSLHILIVG